MMRLVKFLLLAIGLTIATTAGAWYLDDRGEYDIPRIERRLENQERAIREGVRRGELSRHEARRLQSEQEDIRYLMRRMGRDGRLDYRERERLNHLLNRSGSHIRDERQDGNYGRW